jgi:signal transduction histidine kinase/ligand-binding sensor domain-containing protein
MNIKQKAIDFLKQGKENCLVLFLVLLGGACLGQKNNFFRYSVEEGLVQSQVQSICEDKTYNLWIATDGGVSRFDGKTFVNYTVINGLQSNSTTSICADHQNNIWIGSVSGLDRFDGNNFKHYHFSSIRRDNRVRLIEEDKTNTIWVVAGVKLFSIQHQSVQSEFITSDKTDTITSMAIDNSGTLWVSVFKKGIYIYQSGQWIQKIRLPIEFENEFIRRIVFDHQDPEQPVFLSYKKIISKQAGTFAASPGNIESPNDFYISLIEDKANDIWVSSQKGLIVRRSSASYPVNAENGFTSSTVLALFKDHEDNLWLGTNGSGLFRYSFDPFLYYDQFNGLTNSIVMDITQDLNSRIWMGTFGSGLLTIDGNKINNIRIPSSIPADNRIGEIYAEPNGAILARTINSHIWKYASGKFSMVDLSGISCINQFSEDQQGNYLFATCNGFFIDSSSKPRRILPYPVHCMLNTSGDSIIVATENGIFVISNHWANISRLSNILLDSIDVLTIARYRNCLLMGTEDHGLIIYDLKTKNFSRYTTQEGLNSNFVYSIFADGSGQIWIGTERGINKLSIDKGPNFANIVSFTGMGKMVSDECNLDAIFCDNNKNIWFGTSSGVIICKPGRVMESDPADVLLENVKLFSKYIPKGPFTDSLSPEYHIPVGLVLPSGQNNLSFEFRAATFRNANRVLFQYKMEGLDSGFSELSANSFVQYPGLPPGNFRFILKAYTPGAGYSSNQISFPFKIKEPFYKTIWFLSSVFLLLGLSALFIQWYRNRLVWIRKEQMESIRLSEYIKVKERTAEDIHDELGNRLTRLKLLVESLSRKLNRTNPEFNNPLNQIKENINGLYSGVRDILWALNPQSDQLQHIISRIRTIGMVTLESTAINFVFSENIETLRQVDLPSDYSRNILMIFKEAMNNIVKHAKAFNVTVHIIEQADSKIAFILKDDGRGFEISADPAGNGIENMRLRAERMNATLSVSSGPGSGTVIELLISMKQFIKNQNMKTNDIARKVR